MDYATWFPEAVSLRKAIYNNIPNEMVPLFSKVSLPKAILMDQGTPFVLQLLQDLCQLLQVKHLRISVYQPQTDCLVERFNQTVKRMLRQVVDEGGWNWDLLLLYVLFTVQETSQALKWFTPFKLMYGWGPKGLLDVPKEAWE